MAVDRKRVLALLSALFFALWLIPAPAFGQDAPQREPEDVIRVDVNLITVQFSVKDSENRLVGGLDQDAFRILEDGVPQEILFFEPPSRSSPDSSGLLLSFLIDVSGSTFATRSEQILAARTFFDNLQRFTRVGVFGFTDKLIDFQDFTTNREQAIDSFSKARRHLGRTAIYQSLAALIQRMKARPEGDLRKVVILISDGIDAEHSRSAELIAQARLSGTSIYTVLVPSAAQLYIRPEAAEEDATARSEQMLRERQRAAFMRLSTQTGGLNFSGFGAILDFDQTLAQITDSVFGNLYRVAYSTKDRFRNKDERNIEIHVNRPGLRASIPFSSLPEHLNTKKHFISALFGEEARFDDMELASKYQEIGASLDLLQPVSSGEGAGQPFRLKINPLSLSGDRQGVKSQLGVFAQLLDRNGNEVVRLREVFPVDLSARSIAQGQGIIYTNKMLAPRGVYNFRIAILEVSTWKMTAFETVVQIG